MLSVLQKEFRNLFQAEPSHIFFCPGRVNLIGEHIDYNGGHVMPCAISSGTWLAVSKNSEKEFRFHSLNFPEKAKLHLQTSYTKTGKGWFNYPLGVINEIFKTGQHLSGINFLYKGNLPVGAGLSSSASIEVLTCFALKSMFHFEISGPEMALLCKKVENEFIGVSSGIMDQFAVAMGQKNKAILLDCDTLDHDFIPFDTGEYVSVIINSNKQRMLAESKYNERFAECGAALKLLRKKLDVENLCDIDSSTFEKYKHLLKDPILEKRATHVIAENERVHASAKALKENDLPSFGKLLFASHESLRNLYEVSGKELDAIVDFCKNYDGCLGARMTGAGFGGCAIAIIRKDRLENFEQQLITDYEMKIGYVPEIFPFRPEDGVKQLHY